MNTTVGPQTAAVANGEVSAEFAGANGRRPIAATSTYPELIATRARAPFS